MQYLSLKHIILIAVVILSLNPVFSQSIHITGKIVNEKKEDVGNVQITLKYINRGRIIAFAQSSKDGSFELKKENNTVHPDSLELFFSCLGYTAKTQKIPLDNKPMFVELERTDLKLKEVVVSPQKIIQRSDTITYLVTPY